MTIENTNRREPKLVSYEFLKKILQDEYRKYNRSYWRSVKAHRSGDEDRTSEMIYFQGQMIAIIKIMNRCGVVKPKV
jgi:hypothetical protein